jgi:hypothetical protein
MATPTITKTTTTSSELLDFIEFEGNPTRSIRYFEGQLKFETGELIPLRIVHHILSYAPHFFFEGNFVCELLCYSMVSKINDRRGYHQISNNNNLR